MKSVNDHQYEYSLSKHAGQIDLQYNTSGQIKSSTAKIVWINHTTDLHHGLKFLPCTNTVLLSFLTYLSGQVLLQDEVLFPELGCVAWPSSA